MSEQKQDWYDAVDHCDKDVTVSAGRPTITIPAPTPDRAAYLAKILEASKYDPQTVIGGPRIARIENAMRMSAATLVCQKDGSPVDFAPGVLFAMYEAAKAAGAR